MSKKENLDIDTDTGILVCVRPGCAPAHSIWWTAFDHSKRRSQDDMMRAYTEAFGRGRTLTRRAYFNLDRLWQLVDHLPTALKRRGSDLS